MSHYKFRFYFTVFFLLQTMHLQLLVLVTIFAVGAFGEKADKYKDFILKKHNDYRKKQKGSNMNRLVSTSNLCLAYRIFYRSVECRVQLMLHWYQPCHTVIHMVTPVCAHVRSIQCAIAHIPDLAEEMQFSYKYSFYTQFEL